MRRCPENGRSCGLRVRLVLTHPPQAGRGPNRCRRYRSWFGTARRSHTHYAHCQRPLPQPGCSSRCGRRGAPRQPSAWSRMRCSFTHWIVKASAGTTFMPTWTGPIDSLSRHGQRQHTHPAPTRNTHNCHRCPDTSTVIDVLMQDCHRSPEARHCGNTIERRRRRQISVCLVFRLLSQVLPERRGVARFVTTPL